MKHAFGSSQLRMDQHGLVYSLLVLTAKLANLL